MPCDITKKAWRVTDFTPTVVSDEIVLERDDRLLFRSEDGSGSFDEAHWCDCACITRHFEKRTVWDSACIHQCEWRQSADMPNVWFCDLYGWIEADDDHHHYHLISGLVVDVDGRCVMAGNIHDSDEEGYTRLRDALKSGSPIDMDIFLHKTGSWHAED